MKTSLFLIASVSLQLASGQYYEPRGLRATRGLAGHAGDHMSMGTKASKPTEDTHTTTVSSAKTATVSSAKTASVKSAKSAKV